METSQPLGSLAHAVLEQFADLAQDAVGGAVARRQAEHRRQGPPAAVSGHVFTDRELADQRLRPGNWVTIGSIQDGPTTALIEINLRTWESRETATGAEAAARPARI